MRACNPHAQHMTLDPACVDHLSALSEAEGVFALEELLHADRIRLKNP